MRTSPYYDVVIAGAGIVGASAAWHLHRLGLKVAIVDAVGPAAEASGASDGAVSVASKKPGVMARLASESLRYTFMLAKQGGPLHGVFHARPAYVFGSGEAEFAAMDQLADKLASLNGPVRVTSDSRADPTFGWGAGVERVLTLDGEGHMLGHKAVQAYLDPAIDTYWPHPILGVQATATDVTVQLDDREIRGQYLVAALGAATRKIFPGSPISLRAGQMLVTDRGPTGALPGALTAASYLMAKSESDPALYGIPVVIDPLVTGQYLIGSTRENHGNHLHNDLDTVLSLLQRATAVWPALTERRLIRVFTGVRAAVRDGLPMLGVMADSPRVIMATGFEGDGICLSSLIGREVARLLHPNTTDAWLEQDLQRLSPTRFAIDFDRRYA